MEEKNYYLNPRIKKADYHEQYTQEQVAEYIKCQNDPVYFIEKYVKINSLDEGFVPFKLRKYQKKLIVEGFNKHNKVIINCARQTGKTISTAAYLLWYAFFNPDKTIAILANKAKVANEILARIYAAYETIPFFLQPGAKTLNVTSIELGNGSKIMAAATSSSAIRGFSVNFLYLDEFSHIERQDLFFKSVYPTISSGKDTKVVISSTPKGLDLFYKLYTDAEKGENGFFPFRINWDEAPGRDEKWKQEQIEIFGENGFLQEFCCEFLGSANTLIGGTTLRTLTSPTPIHDDGIICINNRPEPGHNYVAMVDVSKGVEADYSTVTVVDITSSPYKICYTWRSNTVSPYELPLHIIPIATKYNKAFLFIERNAIGSTVAEDCNFTHEYENIARTTTVNKRQILASGFGGRSATFGVEMSPIVKKIGCAALKTMIENDQLTDFTTEQIYELSNFVMYRKSFAADQGKHDDLVMNLVMFAWATKQKFFHEMSDNALITKQQEQNDDGITFGAIHSDFYHVDDMDDMLWMTGRKTLADIHKQEDEEFQSIFDFEKFETVEDSRYYRSSGL